mmetsp:Transcript_9461/g.17360  ORF Transcript_9461/g.17360 Transcript_9461/m.17360 type:complete len:1001 (-) Transcript_9461:21-3023(-)
MPSGPSGAVAPLIILVCFLQRSWALEQASADEQVFQSLQQIQAVCTEVDGGRLSGDLAKTCSLVAEQLKSRDPQEKPSEDSEDGRRLDTEMAMDDGNIFNNVDNNPDNDVGTEMDYPWYTHAERYGYPYPHVAVLILFLSLIIFLWETLFLQSTACPAVCRKKAEKTKEEPTVAASVQAPFGPAQITEFWRNVDAWGASPAGSSPVPPPAPCVRFKERVYRCFAPGKAAIEVQRTGPCYGELTVRVKTYSRDGMLAADEGSVYENIDQLLTFPRGQKSASFEVPVFGDNKWDSGKLFMVKLEKVMSGSETLHADQDARVFVIDSHNYPGGMEDDESLKKTLWLTRKFWQECYNIRGCKKVTKCFIGMLYKPVQSVVVTSMVLKYAIDWASKQSSGEKTSKFIIMLGTIQFVSWLIARWADQLQVQNRGRTGGIRQTHRRWLFDKLMIVGQIKHWDWHLSSAEWFYAAVNDVNSLATDVYWQVYVIAQNLWGVFLSIAVLLYWDFKKTTFDKGLEYEGNFLLPCILLVVLVPMSFCIIMCKKASIQENVIERTLCEADWIDYWSWLAHSVKVKFGFSFREISAYEKLFDEKNKKFVKEHGEARDWMNDSEWVIEWLTYIAYMTIFIWGAFALTADRNNDKETAQLTSGEYSVLLAIYSKTGSYLCKLNDSMVLLFRGQVSLYRVQKLLNEGASEFDPPDVVDPSKIELSNILYESEGYFGTVRMIPGKPLSFPLGSFVRLYGNNEKAILSFLAVMGKVATPSSGYVGVPGWCSVVMSGEMPAQPTGCLTVQEEIKLVGACDDTQAHRLARVFGLRPSDGSDDLLPGDAKSLDLLKMMLRDPDVLILARPFAFMPRAQRPQIVTLLRLWQRCGGAEALKEWMSGKGFFPQEKGARKTVVVFDQEDPNNMPGPSPTDLRINLDDYLQPDEAMRAAATLTATANGVKPTGMRGYHSKGKPDFYSEETSAEMVGLGIAEDEETEEETDDDEDGGLLSKVSKMMGR